MSSTLVRVIDIVADCTSIPKAKLKAHSAVDQDIGIAGGDVEDLAEALAKEFGAEVWQWPWERFVSLTEGLSALFPFQLIWQLATWPFRGSFNYPSPYERLELGHIAAVIDNGEWFEP